MNRRLDKIREIEARGEEVKCFVVRHGMDKQTAQEVEGALIDVLLFRDQDGLTNKQRGKDSRNRGLWDFRGHISGGSGFHMPPTTEVNERPDRVIDILKQLVNNFC